MTRRSPIEHRTERGYRTHLRRGQRACPACCEAHNAYNADLRTRRRGRRAVRDLVPCGSEAAYRRHLRRGEYACDACLAAHRAQWRPEYVAARRQRRAAA